MSTNFSQHRKFVNRQIEIPGHGEMMLGICTEGGELAVKLKLPGRWHVSQVFGASENSKSDKPTIVVLDGKANEIE